MSALTLCEQQFRDFQFGLKLIQKNTGQSSVGITAEAVNDPDRFLSELVMKSYDGRHADVQQTEGAEPPYRVMRVRTGSEGIAGR